MRCKKNQTSTKVVIRNCYPEANLGESENLMDLNTAHYNAASDLIGHMCIEPIINLKPHGKLGLQAIRFRERQTHRKAWLFADSSKQTTLSQRRFILTVTSLQNSCSHLNIHTVEIWPFITDTQRLHKQHCLRRPARSHKGIWLTTLLWRDSHHEIFFNLWYLLKSTVQPIYEATHAEMSEQCMQGAWRWWEHSEGWKRGHERPVFAWEAAKPMCCSAARLKMGSRFSLCLESQVQGAQVSFYKHMKGLPVLALTVLYTSA